MQLLDPDFDSVEFLNIRFNEGTKKEEIEDFKKVLNIKITEYILIKLADLLTDEQVNLFLHFNSPKDKMRFLSENIPNLDQKISEELEQFKRSFKNG